MKLIHLPILGLLLAPAAFAADLAPNSVGPLANVSDYLVNKPLQTNQYHLGLGLMQALESNYNRVIQRRLNLAVGLPAETSFGFSVIDTQEYGYDHSVKPIGGYAWLRWSPVRTDLVTVSTTLQFQPGMSTRESRYQASQDRTTLGLDAKIQPLDYIATAVYASYSRRQDERYQDLLLKNETLGGVRVSLGHEHIGIYGDATQRYLETSEKRLFARTWQAGVYLGTENLQASVYTLIPDPHRYPGTFARGFGMTLSARIGATAEKADPRDKPEDAIKAVNKADNEAAAVKVEKEPEAKILETNEMDEFQMLQQKEKEAAKNQQESASEKAEREIREALEKEKQLEAKKAIEQEKAQQAEAQALRKKISDEDAKAAEYTDDINKEINAYTLPDQEDLNWNGLNTK